MKSLMVFQNSEASAILDAAKVFEPGYSVYPDGSRVKYPIPNGTKTIWVQPKAESSLTFEDACGLFPTLVGEDQRPSWGSAVFTAESWPEWASEYFDTSG
jgi:hypothetical protein